MPLVHAAGVSLPVLLGFTSTPLAAFALLVSQVLVIGWLLFARDAELTLPTPTAR